MFALTLNKGVVMSHPTDAQLQELAEIIALRMVEVARAVTADMEASSSFAAFRSLEWKAMPSSERLLIAQRAATEFKESKEGRHFIALTQNFQSTVDSIVQDWAEQYELTPDEARISGGIASATAKRRVYEILGLGEYAKEPLSCWIMET